MEENFISLSKKLFETGSHYVAQVGPKLKLSMGTEIDVPDAHGRAPPVPDIHHHHIAPTSHVTRKGTRYTHHHHHLTSQPRD